MKTIRDPVHGDITLHRHELRIVDTPEFQRLRGIRQLGTSHLVFPGAQHTRFEHSLGTCWLLKRLVAIINDKAKKALGHHWVDRDQARFLGIAALLHDITHIPFGHTFEDERRILPAHDKSKDRLHYFLNEGQLGRLLQKMNLSKALFEFFSAKSEAHPYLYQLVAGPICADLLDYLKRDAYYCGLKMDYDDRIFRYMSVDGGHLCFDLYNDRGFRQDAWSELIHLLRIRFQLTERVYFHHAKMVSGAMLSRILEAMLEAGKLKPADLYQLTDDAFIWILKQHIDELTGYGPLLNAFLSRRLYKRVYMVAKDPLKPDFPSPDRMQRFQQAYHLNHLGERTELEKELSRRLKVPASSIIIYAPDIHMRLKEAAVNVRVDSGPVISLGTIHHPELDALRARHEALWRFFLFMDPRHESKFVRASQIMEEAIGLPNQLELLEKGQLTLRF